MHGTHRLNRSFIFIASAALLWSTGAGCGAGATGEDSIGNINAGGDQGIQSASALSVFMKQRNDAARRRQL